jgi:mercuric ion transport protein
MILIQLTFYLSKVKICFHKTIRKMKTFIFCTVLLGFIACTNSKQPSKTEVSAVEIPTLISADFHINGMTCTGCENTITKGVKSIAGVKEVKASYIDSLAIVTFDSTSVSTALISQKINDLGYNVVSSSIRSKLN